MRYSTDKNRFEGSDGTNWYSLMAPVDIDADTYIDAEGDGDEDKLTFITEGTGKMYLDICGNLGLGKDSKLDHNSRLQVKHDQHEWTYTRLNNDTCFTLDISEMVIEVDLIWRLIKMLQKEIDMYIWDMKQMLVQ